MQPPEMTQFRLEAGGSGVVHLILDCPGRTMNVLSEAGIADLAAFAGWLADADVRGAVIRSGKDNAFCAGADLTELGLAYDMIVAAPEPRRFELAFDHFFRLSLALRALETAGKPVAAAIGGLALGGGCELALAAHFRVLVDDPRIGLGLPESLVGLLPGAGGTQRLPRLIGIDAALPILLDGARLSGIAARDAGLVDTLAAAGDEVRLAEAWVVQATEASQRWDRADWQPVDTAAIAAAIGPARARVLAETLGHYPAPLAILDCVEFGLPQGFEGAIRSEMAIFADLIQREEPRNMITTMFLAKTEYERLRRRQALPVWLERLVAVAKDAVAGEDAALLGKAGFGAAAEPVRHRAVGGYWIEGPGGEDARAAVDRVTTRIIACDVAPDLHALADYAVVLETGYPAYLGGPFSRARSRGAGPGKDGFASG